MTTPLSEFLFNALLEYTSQDDCDAFKTGELYEAMAQVLDILAAHPQALPHIGLTANYLRNVLPSKEPSASDKLEALANSMIESGYGVIGDATRRFAVEMRGQESELEQEAFKQRVSDMTAEFLRNGGKIPDNHAVMVTVGFVKLDTPDEKMSEGELLTYLGTDASRWAEEFVRITAIVTGVQVPVDHMIAWFANAISAGQQKIPVDMVNVNP